MPWDINGNSNTTATNFLGTTEGQPLIIKTHDKEAMRIDPDGKVGIGTPQPDARLQITSPDPQVHLNLVMTR